MQKILLAPPHLGGAELSFLQNALDSGWIAPVGKMLDTFEEAVCAYTGAPYALATNSGTAAIHVGLRALGVGKGDWVICPTVTFIATANPILFLGANILFVDADAQGNISPEHLENALAYCRKTGKKVRAAIVVHLYGFPAQWHELESIAKRYEIPILEDAAEALGGRYAGKALGTLGDVGVFSFNGNKIITTSGGGMLLLPTETARKKALFWATQAKDDAPHYQHSEIGYNYRLSNLLAGVGAAQMQVLPARITQKRAIYDYYKRHFPPEITFLNPLPDTLRVPNYWLTVVLLENQAKREKIRLYLAERGIETRPIWKPLHLQPVFSGVPFFGEGAGEGLFERGLCLPSGTAMQEGDLARCVAAFREAFEAE